MRHTPADPATAAILAVHGEQIRTLQRERREDREATRRELEEMKGEVRGDIESVHRAMDAGFAAVRAELVPIRGEIAPITDLRKRGVSFLAGTALAGMAFGYKFLEPIIKWLGLR